MKTMNLKALFITLVTMVMSVTMPVWAGDVTPSTDLEKYYAGIENKTGDDIRSALNAKINSHTTVSYNNLKYIFQWTDTYNNEGKVIDDIYSECDPAYTTSWCNGDCGYNREHSLPKSWFNEATPLYSDVFHMYPTNCYVNSYRGNEPFGECSNGTKCTTHGVSAKGRKGTSTFSYGGKDYSSVGTVYEPDDAYKGDLARSYFYMVTCYLTTNFTQVAGGEKMFTYSNGKAQLSQYSIDLLLQWHKNDPVSERELVRNEVIYGNSTYNKSSYSQGNRNPFIDYPELVDYIWGDKKGTEVSLASLKSAYAGGSGSECAEQLATPDVTATAGNQEITLTWAAVTGASSYEVIIKHDLYTTECEIGTIGNITGTDMKTCVISGLTNGVEYTITVQAISSNEACNSKLDTDKATPTGELPTYELTWDVNGGNPLTGEYSHGELYEGDPITAPADPTRDGYQFDGWDKDIPTTMPAEDVTLTAQWKKLYTVTWSIDGTDYQDEPVVAGTALIWRANPEDCASGKVFVGWTTDASFTGTDEQIAAILTKADEKTVDADITYNAVFAKATTSSGGSGTGSTTFTFSEIASANNWENSKAYTTVEISPVTITASGGGNNGKWYTSGGGSWRMYSGGTVVIDVDGGSVTGVTSTPSCDFTISEGEATFNPTARTDFTIITVEYSTSGGGSSYSDYSLECGAGCTLESISLNTDAVTKEYKVNQTFSTAGLVVTAHYEENGCEDQEIASGWTVSAPDMSEAGEKTITVTYEDKEATFNITVSEPELLNNLLALKDAGIGTYRVTLENAVVTYDWNSSAFIQDATAGLYLYTTRGALEEGDVINGTVKVTTQSYNGLIEAVDFDLQDAVVTKGGVVTPVVMTIEELQNADYNRYESFLVKIEGATVTSGFSGKNATIEQNGSSLTLRDQNSKATVTAAVNDVVTVTGWLSKYNSNLQFQIFEQSQIEVKPKTYTLTFNIGGETFVTPEPLPYGTPFSTIIAAAMELYHFELVNDKFVLAKQDSIYTLEGWKEVAALPTIVDGKNTVFTAILSAVAQQYEITWSIDGVETSEMIDYGQTPTHAEPTMEPTETIVYTFTGWNPAIVPVTGAATYTAVFEESARRYVTWSVDGVTSVTDFKDNAGLVLPEAPESCVDGKVFAGWTASDNVNVTAPADLFTEAGDKKVTEDVTYYAVFVADGAYTLACGAELKEYTIKVIAIPWTWNKSVTLHAEDNDGNSLVGEGLAMVVDDADGFYTAIVQNYNAEPAIKVSFSNGTKQTLVVEDITASGWFRIWDESWIEAGKYYTAEMYYSKFFDEDGTLLWTSWREIDEAPIYAGPTPYKDASHIFNGWNKPYDKVMGSEYYATYKALDMADELLPGAFSVGAKQKVRFARGNVVHNIADNSWSIARTQDYVVGYSNINLGDPNYKGEVDMFAWSTDDRNDFGACPSNADADYAGNFVDWGVKFGDSWFTPTNDQLYYMAYTRTNHENLWGNGQVAGRKGLIFLPDNWQLPAGLEFVAQYKVPEYTSYSIYEHNVYTEEEWQRMEAAGALFLPSAGRRTGGYGNTMNGAAEATVRNPETGWYSWMDNVDEFGYYWTSTPDTREGKEHQAHYLIFGGEKDSWPQQKPIFGPCEKRRGQAVRLVQMVMCNVAAVAEGNHGVTTGTGVYVYGSTVELTATATAEHYHFVKWSDGVTDATRQLEVTSDTVVTAIFALDQFTITAVGENDNEFGTVSGGGTYDYGTQVELVASGKEHYTFDKWSDGNDQNPRLIEVTEDAAYTAIFKHVAYTITKHVEGEGRIDGPDGGEANETVTLVAVPAEGWSFANWEEAAISTPSRDITLTSDVEVTATFEKNIYTITWIVNGESSTTQVAWGVKPDAPAVVDYQTADKVYTFTGWDKEIVAVAGEATYTAVFSESAREYAITWIVNGESSTTQVAWGVKPDAPAVADYQTAEKVYTFTGWDKEIVAVAGEATYTAVFSESAREYAITWIVNGESSTAQVAWGVKPDAPAVADYQTAEKVYTFTGWDKEIVAVAGDATYTAVFSESTREYTITWIVNGESSTTQVAWGVKPDAPAVADYQTAEKVYTFSGWDKEIVAVAGDATYTAVFSESAREYAITWIVNGESSTTQVAWGVKPDAPAVADYQTAEKVYTFTGWDKEIVAVAGDATYTAQFSAAARTFTVTFVVGSLNIPVPGIAYNTPLKGVIAQVLAQTPYEYDGENWTYEADGNIYTFTGFTDESSQPVDWMNAIVTDDVTYIMTYTVEPKDPTGWENVEQERPAIKVVENGMLYIIRDGKKYSAQGKLVE